MTLYATERRPGRRDGALEETCNGSPSITREKQLRTAVEKASLPASDYRLFCALLNRADWRTGVIPARFQPYSLKEVATMSNLSLATVKRTLKHLERHGWVVRNRAMGAKGIGGAGHATHYQLELGQDCDCSPPRPEPLSDAERSRRYRQRKKAARQAVTVVGRKAAHAVVTAKGKAAQIDVTPAGKLAQIDVTNRLASRDEDAGQAAFSAEEGSKEEELEEGGAELTLPGVPASWPGWGKGSVGAEMNPWKPARIPGVRGQIVPADPGERQALRTLVELLGPVEILTVAES